MLAKEKTMKKLLSSILVVIGISFSGHLLAGQNEFCAGFEEGYKTIKGDMVLVPLCPLAPLTPLGSTDYREGLKAGMRAAGG
jgi:hypothetical protein